MPFARGSSWSRWGRNLHWPTADPEEGSKHDSYHRNPATNRDVAFVDHLIDSLVAEGVADPKRIYLTGWSNGARFAAYYGITRHETSTPGGNKVAAIAPYSGGDPFENIASTQAPSCKQAPYPATTLPFLLISRDCDGIACNQEQFDYFVLNGWTMTPGNQAEGWITTLTSPPMNDASVQWLKIDHLGADAGFCMATGPASCRIVLAVRNHFCWPDGVSDGGGNDRELDMLNFFKANPLP
jgi:poly(3-hydroxybutyrate) depolymerase